jgi:ABC-type lipoprotein export system ATPase subunit
MTEPDPVVLTRAHFFSAGLSSADNVSLRVGVNELLVVTGSEGSGKSALLRGLAGLATLKDGDAHLFGVPWAQLGSARSDAWRRTRARMAFASSTAPLLANLTLFDNLCVPLLMRSVANNNAQDDTERMLHQLGLLAVANKRPPELLSGTLQRAVLARALIIPCSLALIDDPPTGTDVDEAIREAVELGRTVLVSSRDPARFPGCRRVDIAHHTTHHSRQ